jgi:hypothetical protein
MDLDTEKIENQNLYQNANKKQITEPLFQKTFDLDIFLPESKLILGEYICNLCKGVYNDPFLATCGHIFCKKCLELQCDLQGYCPIDNQNISKESIYTVIFLKNMIDKQYVFCIKKDKGCNWQGFLSDSKNHLMDLCQFHEIDCINKNKGCAHKTEKNKLDDHLLNCNYREFNCENCHNNFLVLNKENHEEECIEKMIDCPKGCTEKIKRRNIIVHYSQNCKETVVDCRFKKNGCGNILKRGEIKEHEKEFYLEHLNMLNEILVKLNYDKNQSSINLDEIENIIGNDNFKNYENIDKDKDINNNNISKKSNKSNKKNKEDKSIKSSKSNKSYKNN